MHKCATKDLAKNSGIGGDPPPPFMILFLGNIQPMHVDEVLPYKRPENNFFPSAAIHCKNAIQNIQIFPINFHSGALVVVTV